MIESRVTTFFHSTLTRTASPGTCCLNENAIILAYTNILQIPSHDIGCRRHLLPTINCFREKLQEVFMILFLRASHLPAALCGFPWITTYSFHRLSAPVNTPSPSSSLQVIQRSLLLSSESVIDFTQFYLGNIFRKYSKKFAPMIFCT